MEIENQKKDSGIVARLRQAERQSPRLYGARLLAFAVVLMMADYTFGEWTFHPDIQFWNERPFWSDMPRNILLPVFLCCGWSIVSLGRLKTAKFLLGLFAIIFAGDAFFYSLPKVLSSFETLHIHRFNTSPDKWHWEPYWNCQSLWIQAVLVIGNILLLKQWWNLFSTKVSAWPVAAEKIIIQRSAILKITGLVIFLIIAGIYLVLPNLSVNDSTLSLVDSLLVRSNQEEDFQYLVSDPIYRGKKIRTLLDDITLSELQKTQFYAGLDDSTFQQYVLSPQIDDSPLNETGWRRAIWKQIYPQINHENDPVVAAQTVVRLLRERIGIDPSYYFRVGVGTIWTQQMTDQAGFNRVYVAALRSVGIAARVDGLNEAELWTGVKWQPAPKPPVTTFEVNS